MIRFTVTGNRFEVAAQCKARGIVPAILVAESSHGGSCDMAADLEHEDAARAWQREPPDAPPYPAGTCLCVHRFAPTGILGSRATAPVDSPARRYEPNWEDPF